MQMIARATRVRFSTGLLFLLCWLFAQRAFAETPPTIQIDAPTTGAPVSGIVSIVGTASDDLGLQTIEIKVGAGPWIALPPSTNWSYSWITFDYASEPVTIQARATDIELQTTGTSVEVMVVNPKVALPDGATIVCIGDSITAGDAATTSWPDELRALLAANRRSDVTVYNEGEGGLSSEEFWLDADHEGNKRTDVAGYASIDIAFVMLGHNDLRLDDSQWHANEPLEYAQYMNESVQWLKTRTNANGRPTRVILMTPIPAVEPVVDNNWQYPADFNRRVQQSGGYTEQLLDIASNQAVDVLFTLAPFDGGVSAYTPYRKATPALMATDTLHPNNEGQLRLAQLALNKLQLSGGSGTEQTLTFLPEADTYIDIRSPSANFGSIQGLGLGGGSAERWVYLRFNISGLPSGAVVTDAGLRMRGSNNGGAGAIRRFVPTDPIWSEALPTWNAPLAGADGSADLAAPADVVSGDEVLYPNLAGAIAGNGQVTFVIRSSDPNGSAFRSAEYSDSALRPTLFVTYSGEATPQPPVADAGPDQTLVDEDNDGSATVTLNGAGSSDPDGSIVSYLWTEGGALIATGAAPTVTLGVGVHALVLTVEDDDGQTATDSLTVTVSEFSGGGTLEPPVANAGPDQSVVDADNDGSAPVTLDGTGSFDPDGSIVSHVWNEGGALLATGATPTVNLAVGAHTLVLTVEDDDGQTATDSVVITVSAPLQAPNADAGPDQTVIDEDDDGFAAVTLDGTGSGDPDGNIVSYVWSEGGTPIASGVSPTVNLGVGVHDLVLTVEDDDARTATDSVRITISSYVDSGQTLAFVPAADTYVDIRSPATNFGLSQTLGLGGGNAERRVYLRFDISGLPSGAVVTDAWLRMSGSNRGGAGAIRLFAPVDPIWSETLPTWNSPLAGSDASAELASPADVVAGEEVLYPNLATAVTGDGQITFVIRSSDPNGSAFRSTEYADSALRPTLFVTYSGEAAPQPPIADAGVDQTVVDDDNDGSAVVMLDGSGSSDPDGNVVSYLWMEGGALIATGATPTVNLGVGIHDLQLTVEDDDAQTATDSVQITVAPYVGSEQTVTFLPEDDTYVDVRSPTANYGSSQTLGLGGGDAERHVYLRFAVSGLPSGAVVTDARLRMSGSNRGGAGAIRLFAPNEPDWSETVPTWNSPLAGSDASADLATPSDVLIGEEVVYPNLGRVVSGNGRFTFVVRSTDANGSAFRSSEYPDAALRPTLELTFSQ